MSQRGDAKYGSIDITDGSLPADVTAWGFAPADGAAFTSMEIDFSGNDDKADHGWGNSFSGPALRALAIGSIITAAVVTGTITFYLAKPL